MNMEYFTVFFRKAFNILIVDNPKGTAIGLLAGFGFHGMFLFFNPVMTQYSSIVSPSSFERWHFIAIFVVLFNIHKYWSRDKIPKEIKERIQFIEEQWKAGRMSNVEYKQAHRKLQEKVLDSVTLPEDINSKKKPGTEDNEPDSNA